LLGGCRSFQTGFCPVCLSIFFSLAERSTMSTTSVNMRIACSRLAAAAYTSAESSPSASIM
jgi:hypothetical protein